MGLPMKKNAKSLPTQGKAKQIMDDGAVRGKPPQRGITTKQRGLMAIIATGMVPKKVKK